MQQPRSAFTLNDCVFTIPTSDNILLCHSVFHIHILTIYSVQHIPLTFSAKLLLAFCRPVAVT